MLKLTAIERSALRAEAHALNPIVLIGEAGLTEGVMKEIDLGLNVHGLIKVRVFGDDREARIAMYESICETLKAAPIQHIGKLLVIFRPKQEEKTQKVLRKTGGGLREVTIVKPSPSGTKRPTVSKVMLKGNERVTAGGNIKRAKPRQASAKKSALKGS
ncbi:ribosome assembly RNA-binding protein YhbY [Sapientia aquatica]|uniref:Ribosome assembly RNA-binding protein YhbY n=1 Tax=Sapientia aquatica TaxID=1549640 RepID=A0A4R5W631_9BURK|nr:ribosome assembly RNA-binding protein YhbY [Sapientia aquatica]TDK68592.1 ribosome assembly RNA-binding protein YhbY [Sapientia aquatica]